MSSGRRKLVVELKPVNCRVDSIEVGDEIEGEEGHPTREIDKKIICRLVSETCRRLVDQALVFEHPEKDRVVVPRALFEQLLAREVERLLPTLLDETAAKPERVKRRERIQRRQAARDCLRVRRKETARQRATHAGLPRN